jgi:hypothetical protein
MLPRLASNFWAHLMLLFQHPVSCDCSACHHGQLFTLILEGYFHCLQDSALVVLSFCSMLRRHHFVVFQLPVSVEKFTVLFPFPWRKCAPPTPPVYMVHSTCTVICVGMTFFVFILFGICSDSQSAGRCLCQFRKIL